MVLQQIPSCLDLVDELPVFFRFLQVAFQQRCIQKLELTASCMDAHEIAMLDCFAYNT